ncbi:MAG: histidine kinase [Desulfovibrio sp.]|jgi:CheY-like chemotaxis protein|nr:histidine kinase [Desulfovibrio sp.]
MSGLSSRQDTVTVFLLCASEQAGVLDRRALREAWCAQVSVMTSGVQAAKCLAADNLPDIVVCASKLADMAGERFCSIIRLHPRLLELPVLLILPSAEEVERSKILGSEATMLLGRPYSTGELKKCLAVLTAAGMRAAVARQTMPGDVDTTDFDVALASGGLLLKPALRSEDYFQLGMQCLRQERWNEAGNAFHQALRNAENDAQGRGEAELGLAAAWKGRGNIGRHHASLALAAAAFAEAGDWSRARAVYKSLAERDPSAKNPFLTRARQLLRHGLYNEAVNALAEGFELTSRAQIIEKFSQACLAAPDPQNMLQKIVVALENVLGDRGKNLGNALGGELDTLLRQREVRRHQAAVERQDAVSRVATAPSAVSSAVAVKTAGSSASSLAAPARKNTVALWESGEAPFNECDDDALPESAADIGQISALPAAPPRSSDVISVIKCTWKLFRGAG